MTLRCTAALLRLWKKHGNPHPTASDTATGDWFGNVFKIGGKSYFIFVSSKTLISIITHAAPGFPLPEFIPTLHQALLDSEIPKALVDTEFERLNSITLAQTNDRRVLNAMAKMVRDLEALRRLEGASFDPTSSNVLRWLWPKPMMLLGAASPVEAVRAALGMKGVPPIPPPPPVRPTRTHKTRTTAPSGGDSRFAVRALLQRAVDENIRIPTLYRLLTEITDNPGADLAWFVAHDPDERVNGGATALLFEGLGKDVLPPKHRRHLHDGAVSVLLRAIQAEKVLPARKKHIGVLLHQMQVELTPGEHMTIHPDILDSILDPEDE